MALATQCPHCHTIFKVAHDQLKLRSGLVRCGACKQIFNGIENLVPPEQASTASPAVAAAPDKRPAQPATALPPAAEAAATTAPAELPPAVAAPPEQAVPPGLPRSGQSAIDALEFISVDDPETRTRILASEPEPGQAPAADQQPAAKPEEIDEDPLTRMTLVDFSLFDEEMTEEAAPARAAESPQPGRQSDPIWLDTQEYPIETDAPDAPDAPASQAVPPQDAAADLSAAAAVHAFPADAPADARAAEVKVADEPTPMAGSGSDTASPDEIASAAIPALADFAAAPAAVVDAQDHDDEDTAMPVPMADEDAEEPAFVTRERQRQRRRRVQRAFMAVASVLLFAAVLAQGAYAFRSQLAARFPQTRPMLSQLCDLAGCQIRLPAQIEQVSIESNELQAQSANTHAFTLSLLLRNRSTVAQTWPHIELTLNDKDGKALVRRVLSPREYLPLDKKSAEGIAAHSEQAVKVSFELSQLQASDYRVYLFYP